MVDGLTQEQLSIGKVLLAEGPLTVEYVKEQITAEGGEPSILAKAVLASGHTSEERLAAALLARYRIPKVRIQSYPVTEDVLQLLSAEDARRLRAIPLGKVGEITCFAVENLFELDVTVVYQLRRIAGGPVKLFQTSPQDMDLALEKYYPLLKKEVVKPIKVPVAEIRKMRGEMVPYEHTQAFWERSFASERPVRPIVVERM